jgi:neutral amino acid transport system permease protein
VNLALIGAALGFGLVTASVLAFAAVGFTLQFGATNVFNLAFGDTMTASAFVAYAVMQVGVNIWGALVIGGLFGAVASVLLNRCIYAPFIRRGTKLWGMIIVTLAMSLIIQNVLQAIYGTDYYNFAPGHTSSVTLGPMVFTTIQLAMMGLAVAAMLAFHLLLKYTRLGRAMRATATNPDLARNCGVATSRVIDATWALSGLMCGVGGVVLVLNVSAFQSTTGGLFLIPMIAAAVLGGVGQPYGAMLGALVIGITTEVGAVFVTPDYKELLAFAVLIVVLIIRPQGILAEIASQKEVVA